MGGEGEGGEERGGDDGKTTLMRVVETEGIMGTVCGMWCDRDAEDKLPARLLPPSFMNPLMLRESQSET